MGDEERELVYTFLEEINIPLKNIAYNSHDLLIKDAAYHIITLRNHLIEDLNYLPLGNVDISSIND